MSTVLNKNFRDILSIFDAENVEYLVVGGYALAAHGFPRATKDIDLWVRPSVENSVRVWQALLRFGAPLSGVDVTDFQSSGSIYQIGVPPLRIDVITAIDGVTFEEAWTERVELSLDGVRAQIIGKAKLIQNKNSSGRDQDLVDVKCLLSAVATDA